MQPWHRHATRRHVIHRAIWTFAVLLVGATSAFAQAPAAQDWAGKADWDKTVAAAKKEGKVVVSGPVGSYWRESLTAFKAEYGIDVEFTSANGRDFWPRFRQEHQVGKSLWDIRVSPPETETYDLVGQGHIAPLRDLLVLPEVVSDKAWYGGYDAIYADKAKRYFIGFGLLETPVVWVNRDLIPESELSSVEQLRGPKFKGKISSQNLRSGSAGNNFALLMRDPKYGKDFIRDIVIGNQMTLTDNVRQQIDWLVRGNYPISISILVDMLYDLQNQGIGKNVQPLPGLHKYSGSFGGLMAFSNPPHPNAAKVYANWVLGQKAQAIIAKTVRYNSRRTDVALGEPSLKVDVDHLDEYVNTQSEEMMPYYAAWQTYAKELEAQLK
ncbi:MAG TPA: extracellular solute-binding protein [Alphaproteobacteria bacterium]